MNDEQNDPGSGLDPMPTEDHPTADADPTVEAAAPAAAGNPPPVKPSWKTWIAVASVAALVGAGAVVAISATTSSDSPDAGASTQTDGSGGAVAPDGQDESSAGGNRQGGPMMNGRPGGFGTIASIDGSTLTIEDQSGTTTKVLTSDDTAVTTSETASVADIKVGDTVMVVGTGSSTEIAATRITDDGKVDEDADTSGPPDGMTRNGPPVFDGNGPPGGQMPGRVQPPDGATNLPGTRGVVQSVGNGTFTVTGPNDTTVTVTTDSDTTVSLATEAKVSDLKVGDTVMVQGEESDGTITATRIREGGLDGPMRNRIGGPPGSDADADRGSDESGAAQ